MINVGFIFPSSDYLHDPFRGDPHTHFQILTVLEERLAEKVNPTLIDLRGIKREFAQYHIPECDLYLHSVYTLDIDEQRSIVQQLRDRYPEAKHIAGGPHVTMFQKESLEIFDSIILGDGEENIVIAINDFENSNLKKNYLQEGNLDINQYPYPRRHFLPKSAVSRKGLLNLRNKKGFDQLLTTTVIFSRGCPYQCSFCALPDYSQGLRYRSPDNIKSEIEYLKRDFGIQGISLLDEIGFPLNKRRAISHLEAIASTNVVWRGQCRVDGLSSDIAGLLRESGCVTMCLGVESVSQKSLDLINKKINIERSKQSISLLKENGIETRLYMILGLPGEPENIVEETWNFIKDTNPEAVYLSLLTVRPGTEIDRNPKKFGIKPLKVDWSRTMHMFSRYGGEIPTLTFEYEPQTPWGRAPSNQKIIENYLELQQRIKENGYGPL